MSRKARHFPFYALVIDGRLIRTFATSRAANRTADREAFGHVAQVVTIRNGDDAARIIAAHAAAAIVSAAEVSL